MAVESSGSLQEFALVDVASTKPQQWRLNLHSIEYCTSLASRQYEAPAMAVESLLISGEVTQP